MADPPSRPGSGEITGNLQSQKLGEKEGRTGGEGAWANPCNGDKGTLGPAASLEEPKAHTGRGKTVYNHSKGGQSISWSFAGYRAGCLDYEREASALSPAPLSLFCMHRPPTAPGGPHGRPSFWGLGATRLHPRGPGGASGSPLLPCPCAPAELLPHCRFTPSLFSDRALRGALPPQEEAAGF